MSKNRLPLSAHRGTSLSNVKRIPISLNISPAAREALDLRVREAHAKGFPTERAALATKFLETALRLDDRREGEPIAVVRAMTALLGEIRPMVPGLAGRVEAALRAAGLAEDRIAFMTKTLEVDDGE